MVLGDLEKRVLRYLWSSPGVDAKRVHADLTKSHGGSLNTVQSTLDRLFKKGLLSRTKRSHAYLYYAKIDRRELIASLVQNVACDFVADGENGLVAAFASMSDGLSDLELAQLEMLIDQERRRRSREGHGDDR